MRARVCVCADFRQTGKYEILTNAEYTDAERAGKVKNDVFLGED